MEDKNIVKTPSETMKEIVEGRMMENEYYTPDITDLHVGYECEVDKNIYAGKEFDWEKVVGAENNMGDEGLLAKCRTGKVRTPYLTKEQIEAEGWERLLDDEDANVLLFKSKKKILGVSPSDDSWYRIDYDTETHNLYLWRLYNNGYDVLYYDGECKSINEFRKIISWVGIKK